MEGHPEIQTKAKPAPETLGKSKGSQVPPSWDLCALGYFHTSVLTFLSLSSSMRKEVLCAKESGKTLDMGVWQKLHIILQSVSISFYSKTFYIFNWIICCPEFPASVKARCGYRSLCGLGLPFCPLWLWCRLRGSQPGSLGPRQHPGWWTNRSLGPLVCSQAAIPIWDFQLRDRKVYLV